MITPEQLAKPGTEHAHQCAFFQWLAVTEHGLPASSMFFAVPNGGERALAVAANMKAEGVKPGVPDVVWPVPQGRFTGLWLELKRPGYDRKALGGRSENQERWHKMLIAQKAAVVTCYGWQALTEAVLQYWFAPAMFDHHWQRRAKANEGDCLFVVGTGTTYDFK